MKTTKVLSYKLNDGSILFKIKSEDLDGEVVNPDYVLISQEYAAASRIARMADSAEHIVFRGHVLELLIGLSAEYERLGYAFQALEVDALVRELTDQPATAQLVPQ